MNEFHEWNFYGKKAKKKKKTDTDKFQYLNFQNKLKYGDKYQNNGYILWEELIIGRDNKDSGVLGVVFILIWVIVECVHFVKVH